MKTRQYSCYLLQESFHLFEDPQMHPSPTHSFQCCELVAAVLTGIGQIWQEESFFKRRLGGARVIYQHSLICQVEGQGAREYIF